MKIKYLFSLSLILLTVSACSQNDSEVVEDVTTSVGEATEYDGIIVALGDSLTEGLGVEREQAYPAQLERFLLEQGYNYHVVNSGISGETSSGLVERLDWVLSQDPDIIILTSGANDAIRGLDLSLTEANLSQAIETILARDIKLIFSGMQIYENLGEEYVQAFENLYPSLAQQYELPFIPFFLEGVAGNPALNNNDQIHPNAAGYSIVVEQNIWPVLKEVLENE